jgi:hypothetical protein
MHAQLSRRWRPSSKAPAPVAATATWLRSSARWSCGYMFASARAVILPWVVNFRPLRRSFDLVHANLSDQWLVSVDLRDVRPGLRQPRPRLPRQRRALEGENNALKAQLAARLGVVNFRISAIWRSSSAASSWRGPARVGSVPKRVAYRSGRPTAPTPHQRAEALRTHDADEATRDRPQLPCSCAEPATRLWRALWSARQRAGRHQRVAIARTWRRFERHERHLARYFGGDCGGRFMNRFLRARPFKQLKPPTERIQMRSRFDCSYLLSCMPRASRSV